MIGIVKESTQNPTNLKDVDKDATVSSELFPRTPIIESSTKETLWPSIQNLSPSPSSINSKIRNKPFKARKFEGPIPQKLTPKIQEDSKGVVDKFKKFINKKRGLKNNVPKVIVFSSSHNGIPGIRERYNGNVDILRTATPILTLINIEDMKKLIEIANNVTYVEITAEQGPWIKLLQSDPWKAFSIIMGVLYLLIIMIALFIIPKTYMHLGCALFNPKFWIYPGLGIISIRSYPFFFYVIF